MSDEDLLERLRNDVSELRREIDKRGYELGTKDALLEQRVSAIEEDIRQIIASGETRYVTLARYQPVERISYGLVALIVVAVVGAILGLVLIPAELVTP